MNKLLRTLAIIVTFFHTWICIGQEYNILLTPNVTKDTYMTEGDNSNLFSINTEEWLITADKGNAEYYPKVFKSYITLYYGTQNSNSISITNKNDAIINKIKITYTENAYNNGKVYVGNKEIQKENDGDYYINATSFIIKNANASKIQVRIANIEIHYSYNSSSLEKTTTIFEEGYSSENLLKLGSTFNGYTATCTSENDINLSPTYTSTNTDVATVNPSTGEVTIIGIGTAIIKAEFAGDKTYAPSSAQYSITVIPNEEYVALVAYYGGKYRVSKNTTTSTNFITGDFSVIKNRVIIPGDKTEYAWIVNYLSDNGATVKNLNGEYLALKEDDNQASLSDKKNVLYVKDGGFYNNSSDIHGFSYYNGHMANYEVTSNRPAAKPMVITDGYIRGTKPGNFGTICLPFSVAADEVIGATFYSIAGKRVDNDNVVTTLVLVEETNGLKAGHPYIFQSTADTLAAIYGEEYEQEAKSTNGLIGYIADKTKTFTTEEVASGNLYGVTSSRVQLCGAGNTLKPNRAYINMDDVELYNETKWQGAKVLTFNFIDESTAISNNTINNKENVIYNLNGQKVSTPQKGLYIKNGQKVLIRK